MVFASPLNQVYSMKSSQLVGEWNSDTEETTARRWISLPATANMDEAFALISNGKLRRFLTHCFPQQELGVIDLNYNLGHEFEETGIQGAIFNIQTNTLVLEIGLRIRFRVTSALLLFELEDEVNDEECALIPSFTFANDTYRIPLGFCNENKSLIFLHRNSWLSSVDITALNPDTGRYTQHFFLPSEYVVNQHDDIKMMIKRVVTADNDIACLLHGELVIMKNGLKFAEARQFDLKRQTTGLEL